MKAGTFGQNNDSAAQSANKYDAFRPNRELSVVVSSVIGGCELTLPLIALAAQPTGWLPGPGGYGSF
jgi:hypothetical protein